MQSTNQLMQRKRPLGVTMCALWMGFWGLTICFILVALVLAWSRGAPVQFNVVADVLGLAHLPIAWGVWKLKSWAYVATLVLQGAMFLYYVIQLASAPASALTISLQNVIIMPVLIMGYFLVKRNVYAAFYSPMLLDK